MFICPVRPDEMIKSYQMGESSVIDSAEDLVGEFSQFSH
jgi:hypothetical protein